MNLRSYMRGLGIGMVVTALLMGIATQKPVLSDAEIRDRARKLGMVDEGDKTVDQLGKSDSTMGDMPEEDALEERPYDDDYMGGEPVSDDQTGKKGVSADSVSVSQDSVSAGKTGDYNDLVDRIEDYLSDEKEKDEKSLSDGGSTAEDDDIIKESATDEKETEGAADFGSDVVVKGDHIEITISGGDSSTTVAQKLKKAGLVANAEEYDKFLVENGYDTRITTGRKQIPKGASKWEIAGIITVK